MSRFQPVKLIIALLFIGTVLSPCQAALIFSFSYGFPPAPGFGTAVLASGTLTTDDTPLPGTGGRGYRIQSITGTRRLITLTPTETIQTITGLIGEGQYLGNQNILYYPGTPILDYDGFAFTVGTGADAGEINVFYDPGFGEYSEATSFLDYGENFQVSQLGPQGAVPEPSSAFLMGTGLLVISAWLRSRSRKGS
jgi:hypothetical protein